EGTPLNATRKDVPSELFKFLSLRRQPPLCSEKNPMKCSPTQRCYENSVATISRQTDRTFASIGNLNEVEMKFELASLGLWLGLNRRFVKEGDERMKERRCLMVPQILLAIQMPMKFAEIFVHSLTVLFLLLLHFVQFV
ncbi:unnamed protein product, partial [Heterotrigona itama]